MGHFSQFYIVKARKMQNSIKRVTWAFGANEHCANRQTNKLLQTNISVINVSYSLKFDSKLFFVYSFCVEEMPSSYA